MHHVIVEILGQPGTRESKSLLDCMSAYCSICTSEICSIDSKMDYVWWQQLTVCPVSQEPTTSAVAAPIGTSPKSKKARTSKEDNALLTPFGSLTRSQQRLSGSLLLSRLANEIKDCIVQVLQIGDFMKYLVLSIVLHVPAGSSVNKTNTSTRVFESTLTTLCKLSAGNVSVLAIDMHVLLHYQVAHTICYCGELNI